MRARTAKQFVEIKGHARQIAKVFEQGEEGEEDGHWRQHHRHHPRRGKINAIYEQPSEPPWRMNGCESIVNGGIHHTHQQFVKPVGGIVRADDGEPEHAAQQGQHNGEAPDAVRENAVEFNIEWQSATFVALCNHLVANLSSLRIDVFYP